MQSHCVTGRATSNQQPTRDTTFLSESPISPVSSSTVHTICICYPPSGAILINPGQVSTLLCTVTARPPDLDPDQIATSPSHPTTLSRAVVSPSYPIDIRPSTSHTHSLPPPTVVELDLKGCGLSHHHSTPTTIHSILVSSAFVRQQFFWSFVVSSGPGRRGGLSLHRRPHSIPTIALQPHLAPRTSIITQPVVQLRHLHHLW